MEKKSLSTGVRNTLIIAVSPLILAALFVFVVGQIGKPQYDPAYFNEDYLQKYGEPGKTMKAFVQGVQTGDQVLLAEVQGLTDPFELETMPQFVMASFYAMVKDGKTTTVVSNEEMPTDPEYYEYLFADDATLNRYSYLFREVDGRWVLAETTPWFYLDSGRWLRVWMPLALVWWVLQATYLIIRTFSRFFRSSQEQMLEWKPSARTQFSSTGGSASAFTSRSMGEREPVSAPRK